MSLPPFNIAHPPLMKKRDEFPPSRSAPDPIGSPFKVTAPNFFGVRDPKYPWVGMDHSSPAQWEQWRALQAAQKKGVDHYVVLRDQYWKQTDRKAFGAETVTTFSYEVGTTYTHSKTTQDTTTTQVGAQLGLNLGGNLFGAPPVPPVALPLATNRAFRLVSVAKDGGDDGGDSTLSAEFSFEFSRTLDITTSDEETFSKTVSHSQQSTYLANRQYIFWQIWEDLSMYRVPVGNTDSEAIATNAPIGVVSTRTAIVYVQEFNMTSTKDAESQSSVRLPFSQSIAS